MFTSLPLLCVLTIAAGPTVETRFTQVAPLPAGGAFARTPDQSRAIILIHGFMLRLRAESVSRAEYHSWQRPGSLIVRALGREADVFSFAYGQDTSLEKIANSEGLRDAVARVRKLGYKKIVLIGHSAGGLVARHFVEDNPTCGVTKVVQVCSPNSGCPSADAKVHKNQQVFVDCLSLKGRQDCLTLRKAIRVPDKVQFVCVVGHGKEPADTDGVVPCICQWPPDLQRQGIPAVRVAVTHHQAMRTERGVAALLDLIRHDQPRWKPEYAERARKDVLGP